MKSWNGNLESEQFDQLVVYAAEKTHSNSWAPFVEKAPSKKVMWHFTNFMTWQARFDNIHDEALVWWPTNVDQISNSAQIVH